jgi:hypothetical protein
MKIIGGLLVPDDVKREIRDGFVWIGWKHIPRALARCIHIGALIWESLPGKPRRESMRTFEVRAVDESRFLCRVHEQNVVKVVQANP